MYKIREMRLDELHFLKDMLYEAVYLKEEDKPSKEELLNSDSIKQYYIDWGRKTDKALVMIDDDEHLIGAVWYRLLDESDNGYGFISEEIPEVSIALKKEYRGKNLGTKLMKAIIKEAKLNHYEALSLSVDQQNTKAVNLYNKLNFRIVKSMDDSLVMLKTLNKYSI